MFLCGIAGRVSASDIGPGAKGASGAATAFPFVAKLNAALPRIALPPATAALRLISSDSAEQRIRNLSVRGDLAGLNGCCRRSSC